MKGLKTLLTMGLAAMLLGGCAMTDGSSADEPAMAAVTGTVTYRQRIMLRPDAVLTVKLVDVSRMDVASTIIAEQVISNPGSPPYAFSLEYDPAQIDQRMSYAVQARIEEGGELRFISTRAYPVLTRGAGSSVDILVDAVER